MVTFTSIFIIHQSYSKFFKAECLILNCEVALFSAFRLPNAGYYRASALCILNHFGTVTPMRVPCTCFGTVQK